MSSKRAIRRRACDGKRRFTDAQAAQNAMFNVLRNTPYNGHMNTYRCKFCKGYHFGRAPKR